MSKLCEEYFIIFCGMGMINSYVTAYLHKFFSQYFFKIDTSTIYWMLIYSLLAGCAYIPKTQYDVHCLNAVWYFTPPYWHIQQNHGICQICDWRPLFLHFCVFCSWILYMSFDKVHCVYRFFSKFVEKFQNLFYCVACWTPRHLGTTLFITCLSIH